MQIDHRLLVLDADDLNRESSFWADVLGGGTNHRVRLDMWVGDPVSSHEFVIDRGATVIRDPEVDEPGNGFRVYVSPAGHPFALCWRQ